MELYAFNPGPLDDSVLYDQEKHVSTAIWEGQVNILAMCYFPKYIALYIFMREMEISGARGT